MGFLRRLLGGESGSPARETQPPEDAPSAEDDERVRDLELLRAEQDRLDDLARRQLRYADYAWEPPAQGGERRADDTDEGQGPAAGEA
jgi:hypothetical protein